MTNPTTSGSTIGGLKTPDITAAQILAVIQAAIATAVAFGVDISDGQSEALLGLAAAVAVALGVGDAVIRNGRAKAAAIRDAQAEATAQAARLVDPSGPAV